jgi:hypothetical protein
MQRTGSWATLVAGLVTVGLWAAPATAGPHDIRIRHLAADQVGSRLELRYGIAMGRRHHRRAQLVLHISARPVATPGRRTHLQQVVDASDGRIAFRLAEGLGRVRATVWFTRTGARDEPVPLSVGPVRARRLELAVSWTPGRPAQVAVPVTPMPPPAAPPARPNWAGDRRVVRACGAAFSGTQKSACLDVASRSPFHPVGVIRACERAMDGDANELECLEIAVRAARDPSPALAACDKAMTGDRNELKCLQAAVTAPYEPSAAIAACDKAMTGDRNELACIAAAARAPRDPSRAIEACDRSMSGDRAELECIERGAR